VTILRKFEEVIKSEDSLSLYPMKKSIFYCRFKTLCFILSLLLYNFTAKSQTALSIVQCLTTEEAIALVDSVLLGNVDSVFKKNISVTGDPGSVGYFTNSYVLGFEQTSGLILSSGYTGVIDSPNTCSGISSGNTDGGGDADLELASGMAIQDAVIIEFDMMLFEDSVHLDYIFGSEEYHEWVGTLWNDVFGFFVSGPGIDGPYSNNAINIATVPGTNNPVSISNVNCGNVSAGCDPPPGNGPNCELLQNNTEYTDPGFNQCALDAYTLPFETFQEVDTYAWYHFKLAIGDAGDPFYDSGVFLAEGSVVSIPVPPIEIAEMQNEEEIIDFLDSVYLTDVFDGNKANISFSGDPKAFGYFSETDFLNTTANNGIVLTTGYAGQVNQQNECNKNANISSNNEGLASDLDLEILSDGTELSNVSIFEFDFKPTYDSILFNYVFASEEYHTRVDAGFNDVFGIFLSGPGIEGEFSNNATNIGTIPGEILPVNAGTINFGVGEMTCGGKPEGCMHCDFLVDNSQRTDTAFFAFAFDGYTLPMEASHSVEPGEWYHVKVAIGDAQNASFDSGIFLSNGTLVSDSLMTSVRDFSSDKSIQIRPNPATDYLDIQNFGETPILNYSIFDLSGRLLMSSSYIGKISLSGLPKGLLVIELSTDKISYRKKFIHN